MTLHKQHNGVLLVGALSALVGGVVLFGWTLDIPALKSALPGWVAMKPNTAIAFILTGISLLASSAPGTHPSTLLSRLSRICALFAGLIGLLSLCEYAFGWNPGFDQWIFPEPVGAVGTSHPGRMAPDAALCFVLFAAGWEFTHRPIPTNRTLGAALLFGAAITTIALIEILSYFVPIFRTYGWGGLTMMALPTATAFAALGVALLLISRPESTAPPQSIERVVTSTGLKFVLVFIALTIGIIATGTFYYRNYERQFRVEAEQQLAVIAELKVSELVQYRRERLADAYILSNTPSFTQVVRRFLTSPADADAKRQLQAWFGKYKDHLQYDQVRLLDAEGVTRLSEPDEWLAQFSFEIAQGASEAMRSSQVKFLDFYRNENDQRIYLAMLVPIFDETDGNRPLGVIVMRIDPTTYIYPYLSRWPLPSASAETLLVRREGNEAVFLNELRFQKNTALTLRVSLANTTMPAVKAALGQVGIVDGIDYRGVPVLAALGTVPDSPWFLVDRRDVAEVYAPLRAQLWQVVVMIGVLIFSAGAGVGTVWRRQQVRFYLERIETWDALQKSQSLLIQAEKLGRVGGWEFDIETGQQTWTEMVYDIHELDSTGLPTVDMGISFYTPASQPIIKQAVQRAIELGEPFDLELEIITAKGNLRNVHAIGKADLERGKVSGFFQDITERKLNISALQEANIKIQASQKATLNILEDLRSEIQARTLKEAELKKVSTAIEQTGEMIIITDPAGIIEYVNPAFETVSGYTSEEVIGKTPALLKSGQQDQAFYQNLWETIISGQVWHGRLVNKRKDGRLYTEDASISPVFDAAEKIINYVGVKRDITAELALTAQFQQAQKMESIGRLAGGVAHDYNNMLSVILGYTEMALERVAPSDPLHEDLQQVFDAARRSTDITRQLLAFARKQAIAPVVLDLNVTVDGMLKMLRRLIGEDISLAWMPAFEVWPVKFDPSQLDQILANLCVNGRDAIGGVGKITIETANVVFDDAYCARNVGFTSGAFVMLAVSDSGCGMDKDTLEQIFEPFFTTKEIGKGTGLGLATVYGIVKQNRGFINVYSEPGNGTTFRIYIPRETTGIVETKDSRVAESLLSRGETILLVEDESALLVVAKRLLESLGYTVLSAAGPGEALRMVENHQGEIQLLLTDVIMPGMNGRDLAHRLSTLYPSMKYLFMSGYTAEVITHQGVLDEGVHFIQKPLSKKDLAAKIRKVLDT